MFNQIDLFSSALGLKEPWKVADVSFDANENKLDIYISRSKGSKVNCPVCGNECADTIQRNVLGGILIFFNIKRLYTVKYQDITVLSME